MVYPDSLLDGRCNGKSALLLTIHSTVIDRLRICFTPIHMALDWTSVRSSLRVVSKPVTLALTCLSNPLARMVARELGVYFSTSTYRI